MNEWQEPWDDWDSIPALLDDEQDRTITYPERFLDVLISVFVVFFVAAMIGLSGVLISIVWSSIPVWFLVTAPLLLLVLVPITISIYNKIQEL